MNPSWWRGRRVLITGHTGFKGSWLAQTLLSFGAVVSGLALEPSTQPSLFELLGLRTRISHQVADVREQRVVKDVVDREQPEVVFHLAAQALVGAGYDRPVETYATNVMGTAHVLEAIREAQIVPVTIVVTSDKCYHNREWLWGYRENEALGGEDPYSSSKAAAELVAHAYRSSYPRCGKKIASARAGNVIGGGDWASNRLIPDIVRAARTGDALLLRFPDSMRPWQHVLEPISGYLLLAEQLFNDGSFADAWNFGPSSEKGVSVKVLTEAIQAALGGRADWQLDARPQPHEAGLLRVDSSKARHRLGWRSRLSDEENIRWTADWYSRWGAGEDPRLITNEQIAEYIAR